MTLIQQRSNRMTRKQFWTATSGSVITIAAFVIGYMLKVEIPPGVEAATVLLVGNIIGYMALERV